MFQGGEMMNDTFMKEKPVLPLILSMSLPMVLSMLVNSLYNIIDSFFVAQISEEAMTALSLVYPVQNFINAVGIGFGVVMTVCCITMMPAFLGMFTSSKTVIELGVRYSVIAFVFTLIIIVDVTFEKLFQAVGNMKTTMISLMCGCITNIVLDPVLIFGYGPFPKMGIEGAALATGIGQTLTLAIYLVVYFVRPIRVHIRRQYILLSKKMVIKLYSIGIPATLNLALPSLLISVLNAILAAYSEVYILVLGIYYKLQTFIYLPANGIVQGMRPLIGYNYGAGENKRVRQIYKIVLCMSGIIMVLGTVICLLIPGQLIGLFTHTEATIQTGETALRIIGTGFIVSAVSVTSSGALEGLGKGTPSLLISLCRYVVVIIPTAFLLSRLFGAVGVWNAFWITEAITAIISICVFHKVIAQS
jgi:putative MATE family efflux protein